MATKKTKLVLVSIIGLLIIGLGISITIYRLQKPKPVTITELTPSGTVTLAIPTPAAPLTLNTASTLSVTIDTGGSKVTAVTVELAYDQAKLQINSVSNSNFLTGTLSSPIISGSKVLFTYAAPPESGGKQGVGTLATLNLKPLVIGQAHIFFGKNSLAAAIGFPGNVLKTANPVALTVISLSPSPSPSPSPAASPSPAPSPSPTPIPGDITDDGDTLGNEVNIYDYSLLVADFGKTGSAGFIPADITKDGKVDIFDYNELVANFGK